MRTVAFVGVSTGGSLIHRVFPRWARLLGLGEEVAVVGVDVPRDAPPERFRAVLRGIRDDAGCLGAVVTSHKTALYRNARAQFAFLDPLAEACQEVNSVRNTPQGLHGYARDPVSVGRVVDGIRPEPEADLLCLGSGGTAIALARHLLGRGQRGRLTFLDRDPAQAEHFAALLEDPRIESLAAQGPYDELVAAARPGTLVVNATGAGKDRTGSPVTDEVRFPPGCVFWDLNYRGDLRMLAAARAQAAERGLRVHDGRSLFCHGWAAALTAVLDLPENPQLAASFAALLD